MAGRASLAETSSTVHPTDAVEPLWIIVCEKLHGAVGPVASEERARELAVLASEAGGCSYRAVQIRCLGRHPSGTGTPI